MKKDISNILYILLMVMVFGLSSAFGQKECVVSLTTDNYPSETYWVLYADSLGGDTIHNVLPGHYTQANTSYLDTCYIADTINTIVFLMKDSYGDGMDGSYYVTICEDTIINYPTVTFNSGLYSTRTVPQCMPNPPPGPCVPATVIINLDQYQTETSWEITDTLGTIVAYGGNYGAQPDYGTVIVPVCIPVGPLNFTIFDAYGDGLNGSQWQGQDGSYFLKQCNDTLVFGTDPAFGSDSTHVFVSDTCPPIYGCMDPAYLEFNPIATADDSSCQVLKVFGCTDSSMYNYDPNANSMDLIDSCQYTLILHDLMGNGWVGSTLEIIFQDSTYQFTHTGSFDDVYYLDLTAPELIVARFLISAQASLTTIECGFTLMNPEGDVLIEVQPPFIQPLFPYTAITNCGNTCIEKEFGCTDSTALNYVDSANTDDGSCYYVAGCMNPLYLEYDSTADFDNGSCSTLIVVGCMDSTALNYDPNANVELTGSCISIIYGCMNPLAFNYNPNANVDDSTCVSLIYGCIDATMYNYCDTCNTDDGSCEPFVYGCTDSTMFNFNPLANADNNSCVPYIYGCTDPSMLNYNPQANTEDFSCIPYIYGCTDSTALNYDSTANTNNGSCIEIIEGCMDPAAFNYNSTANVSDSTSCLYSAGCITGPGNPYWLNDPCYAWVIDVDNYCCNTTWDTYCQAQYDYCAQGWPVGLEDLLSRDSEIVIYPNPTSNKVYLATYLNVYVKVYNSLGMIIYEGLNLKEIDLSKEPVGLYNLTIEYEGSIINNKIIKQ